MRYIKFNINKYVKVKLTDFGRKILIDQHEDLMRKIPENARTYLKIKEDDDGWYKMQMWVLMETFGPYIKFGGSNPFETEIEFEC